MNKLLLIGAAVVVVAVGGYVLLSNNHTETEVDVDTSPQDTNEKMTGTDLFQGTFAQLLMRNEPYTCTFFSANEHASQQGTVYINGDNMRGEYIMQTSDAAEPTEFDVLKKGDELYTWSSDAYGGFAYKMNYSETHEVDSSDHGSMQTTEHFNTDEEYDFDCRPWDVDPDIFDVPGDVAFQDLSAQMNAMMQVQQDIQTTPGAGIPDIDCSVCDAAPEGPQREQCLAALGC